MLIALAGFLVGAVSAWLVRAAAADRERARCDRRADAMRDQIEARLSVADAQLTQRTARVESLEVQIAVLETGLRERGEREQRWSDQLGDQGEELIAAHSRIQAAEVERTGDQAIRRDRALGSR